MAQPVILGVDPGARETGLALVRGDQLLAHAIVERATKVTPTAPIDLDYLEAVIHEVANLGPLQPIDAVAIEEIKPPNPHLGMTNAGAAIATGAVLGAIASWAGACPDVARVMLIATAQHGSGFLQGYPAELRGARETKGTGKLRHARSAYDVALAARWHLKTRHLAPA